jgi:glycosyltransferase 2 family protein
LVEPRDFVSGQSTANSLHMNKKFLIYGVGLAVLAALVYLQFRTWRHFDWAIFWRDCKQIDLTHILVAIVLIYATYVLRALRWKFLVPTLRTQNSWWNLVAPTLVGFTGLALLGRPGELIRPFLIARREKLNFSSQMAAWTLERISDIGGFTVLLMIAVFAPRNKWLSLESYRGIEIFGLLFLALTAGISFGAISLVKYGDTVSDWVEKRFAHFGKNLGSRIAERLREFHQGLNTIDSPGAFLKVAAVSIVIWLFVSLSYFAVVRSYPALGDIGYEKIFPLMGSSMVGSLIQLPGVGGGSQLGTISVLHKVYNVGPELAASCGILLWVVTFVSVVPAGLVLTHFERLSLHELSQESQQEEISSESAT